jgi:hypothetical protein
MEGDIDRGGRGHFDSEWGDSSVTVTTGERGDTDIGGGGGDGRLVSTEGHQICLEERMHCKKITRRQHLFSYNPKKIGIRNEETLKISTCCAGQ